MLLYHQNHFKRHELAFCVVLCDLDNFKGVNDIHGHLAGDTVLKRFAKLMKDNVRVNDLVGRWGGEEFLIICPNTGSEGAKQLSINLKELFAAYLFPDIGHVTASFGIAEYNDISIGIDELLNNADVALYESKNSGRNDVTVYQQ